MGVMIISFHEASHEVSYEASGTAAEELSDGEAVSRLRRDIQAVLDEPALSAANVICILKNFVFLHSFEVSVYNVQIKDLTHEQLKFYASEDRPVPNEPLLAIHWSANSRLQDWKVCKAIQSIIQDACPNANPVFRLI